MGVRITRRRWYVHTLDDAAEDGTVLYACYTHTGKLRGVAHTLEPIRADAKRHGASLELRGSQGAP